MKFCFQFDLWRPSPGHLEPAGTRERQAPVSSRHAGKTVQAWLTQRVQKSLVYSANIKNPVERKQTNKQTKKRVTKWFHKAWEDDDWWLFWRMRITRFRMSFENLFRTLLLALFLPFTFRSSSVVHFIRRQKSPRSVFYRKKRLIFNVAKFPLVSIFICLSLFQGLPTDGFLLNSLKTPF